MNPWAALIKPAFELIGRVFSLLAPYFMGRSAGKNKERLRETEAALKAQQERAQRDREQMDAVARDRSELAGETDQQKTEELAKWSRPEKPNGG